MISCMSLSARKSPLDQVLHRTWDLPSHLARPDLARLTHIPLMATAAVQISYQVLVSSTSDGPCDESVMAHMLREPPGTPNAIDTAFHVEGNQSDGTITVDEAIRQVID